MTSASQTPQEPYPMRLQKFLARAGVASRRGSENLMTAGRVSVNGVVTTELGSKVDPKCDIVCVDGNEVNLQDEAAYLILNKPAGYLTTMSDPHGRPCVASLVPTQRYPGLFPVGRLDMDTTGILLFTTDGDLGQHLLHPKYHVEKTYLALVEGVPTQEQLDVLRAGVTLDDGPAQPAIVDLLEGQVKPGAHDGSALVQVCISEGRKRQVKRMLLTIHHKVLKLHRSKFGPLQLNGLEEGKWRMLSPEEVEQLKRAAGL